jgi:hypothetical protein
LTGGINDDADDREGAHYDRGHDQAAAADQEELGLVGGGETSRGS